MDGRNRCLQTEAARATTNAAISRFRNSMVKFYRALKFSFFFAFRHSHLYFPIRKTINHATQWMNAICYIIIVLSFCFASIPVQCWGKTSFSKLLSFKTRIEYYCQLGIVWPILDGRMALFSYFSFLPNSAVAIKKINGKIEMKWTRAAEGGHRHNHVINEDEDDDDEGSWQEGWRRNGRENWWRCFKGIGNV